MPHAPLADLRARLPGCELALLVDVTTGTCLVASSLAEPGQEALDDLCDLASRCLQPPEGPPERFALVASPTGIRVFLRRSTGAAEALCLALGPSARLDGIEDQALGFLETGLGAAAHG